MVIDVSIDVSTSLKPRRLAASYGSQKFQRTPRIVFDLLLIERLGAQRYLTQAGGKILHAIQKAVQLLFSNCRGHQLTNRFSL